ncbi:MAG TPA: ABC transporter ATP-binding protein, partial [Gemmatimonadaceae bacterium]|nr:ABC transporter ATP-binding protein [Gemmatimonadaceae bacterium]
MTVQDPILIIDGLTKRYGKLPVLQHVDVAIARGRVTAILGPNGAGKTTLIKTILGLTSQDEGTIALDGRALGDDPRARATIGYMPQIARFPENLTGAELIAMLLDLRGRDATIDRELVDRFRLEGALTKPLRTLSGGTRQKVNAVLAFLFTPRLLILDEPTAGLDPIAGGVLKDKIRDGREQGRTILLASHVMTELEELADDVVFLLDGAARFAGSIADLKRRTLQLNLEHAAAQLMRESAGREAA